MAGPKTLLEELRQVLKEFAPVRQRILELQFPIEEPSILSEELRKVGDQADTLAYGLHNLMLRCDEIKPKPA